MVGSVEDRIRLVRSPGPGAKGGIDRDGENGLPRSKRKGGHWHGPARAGRAARSRARRGARAPTGDRRGSSLTPRTPTPAWPGPKAVRRRNVVRAPVTRTTMASRRAPPLHPFGPSAQPLTPLGPSAQPLTPLGPSAQPLRPLGPSAQPLRTVARALWTLDSHGTSA